MVPSYLSKGLEFDSVVLVAMDERYDPSNELDIKLQYVGMTRPLHQLTFISTSFDSFIG